jgi:hypothetical protein
MRCPPDFLSVFSPLTAQLRPILCLVIFFKTFATSMT